METIGLVPQSAVDRQILDGSKYDHLFAKPKLKDEIVKRDAHATDTVQQMIKIVNNHYQEVANAVPLVKVVKDGKIDVKATCKKLFDLVFNYVKYNREDGEKLRTPAMTWYHAQVMARKNPNNPKYSADCDCFSIFIASFLKNMGIPYVFRITGYKDYFGMVGDWQHVYVVVPQNDKNIIIDPVTNYFDYQKQPAKKRDFNMYGQEVALQGVDIHVLSGTDDLSGRRRQPRFQRGKKYRFKKREFIQLNSRPKFLREELLRIKQIAVKNPKLMRGYNPQQVKKWIDELLAKWNDTTNFLTHLATIARLEKDLIRKKQLPQSLGEEYVSGDLELQGYFGALYDAHTEFLGEIYDAVYGIDELVGSLEEADIRELEGVESEALAGFGEVDLGKLKRPKVKALLKKIAAPVKKVVKVAAKVAKAPVRIAAKVVKATVKIPTAVVKRVVVKAKAKQERKKVLKKAKIAKKVARKTQKVARKTQKVNTKKSKFLKKIPIPEQEIVDQNPYMEQQEIVDQNPYMEQEQEIIDQNPYMEQEQEIIDQNPYEEQDAEQQISNEENEEDENVEVDVAPVEEQSNESENTEEVVAEGEEMQGLEGKIFKKIKKFVVKTRKINPAYVAVRNAFRALVALNFRGIASAVNGNPKRTQKVVERFEKMGGKKDLILKSIANGAKRKPLFGQSKKLKGLEGLGITTEALIATGGSVVSALIPQIAKIPGKDVKTENSVDKTEKLKSILEKGKKVGSFLKSKFQKNKTTENNTTTTTTTTDNPPPTTGSFASRNKTTLIALGAIGVAGLGYFGYRYFSKSATKKKTTTKTKGLQGLQAVALS